MLRILGSVLATKVQVQAVRCPTTRTGLRVTFERDGQEQQSEVATTSERTLNAGILMLARLDDLQAGDVLRCTGDLNGRPLPPPRTKHA
jgi:hypothetical protein